MPAPAINTKLIESLAQMVLALSVEEQALLSRKLQDLSQSQQTDQRELESFFQSLKTLPTDPTQPSLAAISDEVKAVRHELWLNE